MKNRIIIAAIAVLGTFSSGIFAASDGDVGTTSTGTTDIQLVVPDLVRISSLSDIDLGTYSGMGTETGNTEACIFRNGAGTYSVTATTNKGAFRISRGAGGTAAEDIDFDAYWNDVTGTTGRAALTYNTALTTQSGTNTASITCGGGTNANFSVEIAAADMQTKNPATYSATVTIVIAPE